jgi:eukaryotic-like serine/threonine-protein kinase
MSARAPVKPGDVLGGKYKVERILGVGGMGIVVAAKHKDLGQLVALKFMLKEAMADRAHAERFLREAKAAVQLKSPHTARVLDVGRLKNDEPFMVMEYLEGRDLDAELRVRGPMPPIVAVNYILQVCEALAEAHGIGMIHRDVKLKNLFLTSMVDGRPLVKILDFGLAKQLGSHGDVSLTATNSVFGSPQYMSPEQMRSAKDADHRSDIWSLGVCLYELLTGRVPYDASAVAEICAMVLKDPVPPPSQFAIGLPPDLEDVILRCLEKDPGRRFQSVADLAYALQSYAMDEGSARRILHVMQTAQRLDHPTFMSSPQVDGGPKTLNAWDSGVPNRRTTWVFSRVQLIVMTAFATMGLIGCVIIIVVFSFKAHPPPGAGASSATSIESPAPPAAAEPPSSPTMPITAATAGTPGTATGAATDDPPTSDTAPAPMPGTESNHKAPMPTQHGTTRPVQTGPAPPAVKTPTPPVPTPTPPPRSPGSDPGDHM